MKTTLLYGLLIAVLNFIVSLAFSVAGFYGDPQKIAIVQAVIPWTGLIIGVAFTTLGIRACRAAVPPQTPFTYGNAVAAGELITLWAALAAVVTTLLFFNLINPDARETLIQLQLDKAAAQGRDPHQVEGFVRAFMGNVGLSIWTLALAAVFGTIITLVVSFFLRRAAPLTVPAVTEPPAAPSA